MKMSNNCRIWWPDNLSKVEKPDSVFLFGWIVSSSSDSLDIVVAFACNEATMLSVQSDLQGILNEINCQMPESLHDKCTLSLLGHCGKTLSQLDINKLVSVERSNWIQLLYKNDGNIDRKIKSFPALHHMNCGGKTSSEIDLHVILYETPIFGSHHFSMECWTSKQIKTLKAPMWFESLYQKQPFLDLDTIVLTINSAHAAKLCFERCVGPKGVNWFPFRFINTCKHIRVSCYQILYWPVILGDNGLRSKSCVEYAEKAATHRHSMWSSIATDFLLDNLLRSGCVWLMGVPAGFKLNTELAGVLGMICLNMIQIWSTLWFFIALHWIISHLYSFQIKAITAMWRLFRVLCYFEIFVAVEIK